MKGRHVYLIAIMDWYSLYVIHWAVSPNMEAEFCVEALRNALLLGRCVIFNTDQAPRCFAAATDPYVDCCQNPPSKPTADTVFNNRLTSN